MNRVRRLGKLVHSYTLGRNSAKPSTADFWYRQALARVTDEESLQAYLKDGEPYPLYLFDQTVKLGYRSVREDGVVLLHYEEPIGDQENPEAAFQYALGAADQYRVSAEGKWRDQFLGCADYYVGAQLESGGYPYFFDYSECRAPWSSALAQARGVSVMVRAWMLTGEERYLESAKKAISQFSVPIEDGGFLAVFEPEGCSYFEEYPEMRSVVMNGFLSTVFGLFEMKTWAKDEEAERLLDLAYDSLEKMLPHFATKNWTLYDLRAGETRLNPHSVFYHVMVVEYLKVLATIEPRPVFKRLLEDWSAMDRPWNRAKATWSKLLFKVSVR